MPNNSLLLDAVRTMLIRDLGALDAQVNAYPNDASLWLKPPGISNAAGTLVLHLCGNLRYFVGGVLGKDGYVRNRDAEFAMRDISRDVLSAEIAATIAGVSAAFDGMTPSAIEGEYPVPVGQPPMRVRTSDMLVHLTAHLTYHLGQIDYHRRLLTPSPLAVENLSLRVMGAR